MGALKFRVLLDTDQEGEIFRDILIDEDANLEVFYKSIISSFGFDGGQMASFYISNDDWDKGPEISLMDLSFEGDEALEDQAIVMSSTLLCDNIEVHDQKLILVHDFLRMWIFLIELIDRSDEMIMAPEVVLSMGTPPAEDSKEPNLDIEDGDLDFSGYEDEFGGDEFEDGYDEEDFNNMGEQDY